MKSVAIYILENVANGKLYVGQTVNFKKRMQHHKAPSNKKSVVGQAISKYTWDNFKKHMFYIPESLLDYFETELIKQLKTLSPNGYNLETGGHKNKHLSEETITKMSEASMGDKNSMFNKKGENCPGFGKTDERSPNWKSDKVTSKTIRKRKRKLLKRQKDTEFCLNIAEVTNRKTGDKAKVLKARRRTDRRREKRYFALEYKT